MPTKKKITTEDVIDFILDQKEIGELRRISLLLKSQYDELGRIAKSHMKYGDEVEFNAKRRGIVRGKIVEMRRKRIVVIDATTGMRWRVSPSLCTIVGRQLGRHGGKR